MLALAAYVIEVVQVFLLSRLRTTWCWRGKFHLVSLYSYEAQNTCRTGFPCLVKDAQRGY